LLEPAKLFNGRLGQPQDLKVQQWVSAIQRSGLQEEATTAGALQYTVKDGVQKTNIHKEDVCLLWGHGTEGGGEPLATPDIDHRVSNHII
jgi:hypothetical protein